MKSFLYLAFISACLFIAACKPLDKLVSFNLETSDHVTWLQVPDSVLTDTLPNEARTLVSETYRFSDYDKFVTNRSTPQTVEGAEAFNMFMSIDSGSTNFGFAKDLAIFISSPSNLFEDVKLLDIPVPTNLDSTINLDMLTVPGGWVNIIQKNEYRFRTDFTLISTMPDTVHLKYKMNFRLKALPNE